MATPKKLTRDELETAVMDRLRSSPTWRSYDEPVFKQAVSMKTTKELENILAGEEARERNRKK